MKTLTDLGYLPEKYLPIRHNITGSLVSPSNHSFIAPLTNPETGNEEDVVFISNDIFESIYHSENGRYIISEGIGLILNTPVDSIYNSRDCYIYTISATGTLVLAGYVGSGLNAIRYPVYERDPLPSDIADTYWRNSKTGVSWDRVDLTDGSAMWLKSDTAELEIALLDNAVKDGIWRSQNDLDLLAVNQQLGL